MQDANRKTACVDQDLSSQRAKKNRDLPIFVLHSWTVCFNIRARCTEAQTTDMRKLQASSDKRPEPPLQKVSDYLRKNFPDFFAEARFQVGDDDYFLYARFGAYLARAIEHNRTPRQMINRGFTVLNKMARASAKHPRIRQMLLSGPLEYIVDAPKARALARKRLSPVAQGYLEGLCE